MECCCCQEDGRGTSRAGDVDYNSRSLDSLVDGSDNDDDDDDDDGVSVSSSDCIRASSSVSHRPIEQQSTRRWKREKLRQQASRKTIDRQRNPSLQQHGTASNSRGGRGHGHATCTAAPTGTDCIRRTASPPMPFPFP